MKRSILVSSLILVSGILLTNVMVSCNRQTDPLAGSTIIDDPYQIELVYVPAGDLEWEAGVTRHAMTIHLDGFYVGKYEVTQRLWKEVMGEYPVVFDWENLPIEFTVEGAVSDRTREIAQPTGFIGDDLPVETVSWDVVQEFLGKLSESTGHVYRLPSSAEWEYFCRAGTETDYSFGDDPSELVEYEWYGDNSDGEPHPVGQKKANPWGLYDVSGNIAEWTSTIADMAPYERLYPDRDFGPGTSRIYRGSHYLHNKDAARCGYSHTYQQALPRGPVGLRVVREIER